MPSFDHWDILVRAAAVVALAVGCLLPGGWRRRVAPLARRPWACVAVVVALSLMANATVALRRGLPRPRVHDEFSYLLAADTFAHGRLANPTPPCPDSFQSPHVLLRPTYASKYPPAQGLALAVGQRLLGRPVYGVWLSCALAAVAVTWMARSFVPADWALLAGTVAAVHPLLVDWGGVYWGGAVAALGGALVIGAWARLLHGDPKPTSPHAGSEVRRRPGSPHPTPALLLGLGLLILANSRPYEGLALSLPLLASLGWRRPAWPAAAVLLVGGAAMATYDAGVTGHPLRMPFAEYAAQFDAYPKFWFLPQRSPPPAYPNATMARVHTVKERGRFDLLRTWPGRRATAVEWLRRLRDMHARPAVLLVPLAAAAVVTDRRARWLWLTLAAVAAGLMAENWFLPHYAAPAVPAVLLLMVLGWRRLATGPLTARLGRGVLAAFAVTAAGSALAPPDPDLRRFTRDDLLAEVPTLTVGRHVVLVRYAADHPVEDEWVYNGCDLAAQPILWARSLSPAADAEVLGSFGPRHAWLLTVGRSTHTVARWTGPARRKGPDPADPVRGEAARLGQR